MVRHASYDTARKETQMSTSETHKRVIEWKFGRNRLDKSLAAQQVAAYRLALGEPLPNLPKETIDYLRERYGLPKIRR